MVPSAGCPPLELTVMAVVAPACPLTLAPALLDLATVHTHDTVSADIHLTNHLPFTYNFAFVDLPESVLIEPGGGCGTILPQEVLTLQLLYCPTARDLGVTCGRPGGQGETLYKLRCYTSVSLASLGQEKEKKRSSVSKEQRAKYFASSVSSNYLVTTTPTPERSEGGSVDVSYTSECDFSIPESGKSKDDSLQAASLTEEVGAGDNEEEGLEIRSVDSESDFSLRSDTQHLWEYYSTYQLNGPELTDEGNPDLYLNSVEEERTQIDVKLDAQNEKYIKVLEIDKEKTSVPVDKEKEFKNQEDEEKEEIPNEVNELEQSIISSPSGVNLEDGNTDYITEREEACPEPSADQRFTSLSVRAWLKDPLVELSSQVVLLPPTPCNSHSLAYLYIRSKLQKKCGIHERNTSFKTSFEFTSSDKHLIVEPKRGSLQYKQSVKVSINFNPKLSYSEVFSKAFEMKLENMKWIRIQELLDQYYQSKVKKGPKVSRTGSVKDKNEGNKKTNSESKKGTKSATESKASKSKKRSKGSVMSSITKKSKFSLKSSKVKKKDSGPLAEVTVDPSKVEVTEEDLRSAEEWLLKYLEPDTRTVRILCLLDTDLGDGHGRRLETLECHVVCPTVAPTIILSSSPCLEYGPTATGTRSKMYVSVTNISFFDACVELSTLNPVGPFMCPAALEAPFKMKNSPLELPPENILKVPIVFQPTVSGEVMERFEVVCGSTILQLQARGEGVTPSFSFSPEQEVFTLTGAAGKKVDLAVSIRNLCRAGLRFHVRQEFLKEGLTLPVTKPSPPESPGSSVKQKGKTKKDKKKKSGLEFTSLTHDLVSCFENEFVDLTRDAAEDPIFKIIDVDSYVDVLAEDTKTITIRFTPPQLTRSRPDSGKTTRTKDAIVNGKAKNSTDKVQNNKSPGRGGDVKTVDAIPKKGKKEKAGGKKEKRSLSEKSVVKEKDKCGKRYIVSKYSILLGDDIKVKDLVFIGITKK